MHTRGRLRQRIGLREIVAADLPAVYRGLSDPSVIAHYGISYASLDECAAQMQWYAELTRSGLGHWWIVEHPARGETIGAIGYNGRDPEHRRAEIGYWLYPEYWGQGLMSEAMGLFLERVFTGTNLHRLHAEVELENGASARLLERWGFCHEGTAREVERKGDRFISLAHYALLRPEWLATRG